MQASPLLTLSLSCVHLAASYFDSQATTTCLTQAWTRSLIVMVVEARYITIGAATKSPPSLVAAVLQHGV